MMRDLINMSEKIEGFNIGLMILDVSNLCETLEMLCDDPNDKIIMEKCFTSLDETKVRDLTKRLSLPSMIKDATQGVNKINEIITRLSVLLQNTRTVTHFDEYFEKLKTVITERFPNLSDIVSLYGDWAAEHPTTQIFVTNLLIVVATLEKGYTGLWIADGLLRAGHELIKGRKLSSVIGKAMTTSNITDLVKPTVLKIFGKDKAVTEAILVSRCD